MVRDRVRDETRTPVFVARFRFGRLVRRRRYDSRKVDCVQIAICAAGRFRPARDEHVDNVRLNQAGLCRAVPVIALKPSQGQILVSVPDVPYGIRRAGAFGALLNERGWLSSPFSGRIVNGPRFILRPLS